MIGHDDLRPFGHKQLRRRHIPVYDGLYLLKQQRYI